MRSQVVYTRDDGRPSVVDSVLLCCTLYYYYVLSTYILQYK